MIWFAVTEPLSKAKTNANYHLAKYTLEQIAGDICLEINYAQVNYARFKEMRPWAIVHSGGPTPIRSHGILEERDYIECLREWSVPQFCICKSHQMLGAALGGITVDAMRPLRPGEQDSDPSYYSGFYKESGMQSVQVLKDDQILGTAGSTLAISQSHAEELKGVPEGFELLASSADCEVQALRSLPGAPLRYSTQFHPERHNDRHPDGCLILERFFKLAHKLGKQ